jgi:hypothetical protein
MLNIPLTTGIFTRTSDPENLDKILQQIGADFTAIKTPAFDLMVDDNDKIIHQINPFMCNIKHKEADRIIGAASTDYGIVQYREAVAFLKDLMEKNEARVPLASLTFGGARLHLLATTDEVLELPGGDKISCFFSVSTSHNRTLSMTVSCTPVHDSSQTIFTPLDNGVIKIRHTVNAEERIRQAKHTLSKIKDFWRKHTDTFDRLANTRCDNERTVLFLGEAIEGDSTRVKNTRDKITDIFQHGPTSSLPSCKETLFGLVIAVQIYADYYKSIRENKFGYSEIDVRIESRLTGDGARLKADSFAIGLRLAGLL